MTMTTDILAAIDEAIGDSSVGPDAMRCNAAVAAPLVVKVRAEITTDDGSLFTPDEWCRITGTRILDPDGWRGRNGRPWDEPITLTEFRERAGRCTQEMRAYRPSGESLEDMQTGRRAMERIRARCAESARVAAWRMISDSEEY